MFWLLLYLLIPKLMQGAELPRECNYLHTCRREPADIITVDPLRFTAAVYILKQLNLCEGKYQGLVQC